MVKFTASVTLWCNRPVVGDVAFAGGGASSVSGVGVSGASSVCGTLDVKRLSVATERCWERMDWRCAGTRVMLSSSLTAHGSTRDYSCTWYAAVDSDRTCHIRVTECNAIN